MKKKYVTFCCPSYHIDLMFRVCTCDFDGGIVQRASQFPV